VKLPTITPTAPLCQTATRRIVAATVITTLAIVAATYETERSSTRKSDVSCS
jgi:hypothetical protein